MDLLSNPGNMNAERITKITIEFFKQPEVLHLNIHELKFFLSEAFAMKYGKIYAGFGLDVLLDWFDKFWAEREKTFEALREEQRIAFSGYEKQTRSAGTRFQANTSGGSHKDLASYEEIGEVLKNLRDKK